MKVIKSLENKGTFLKELIEKILVKKEDFSIFQIGLPLMKNVLTSLAQSVLISLGLTAAASVTDATNQKTF